MERGGSGGAAGVEAALKDRHDPAKVLRLNMTPSRDPAGEKGADPMRHQPERTVPVEDTPAIVHFQTNGPKTLRIERLQGAARKAEAIIWSLQREYLHWAVERLVTDLGISIDDPEALVEVHR